LVSIPVAGKPIWIRRNLWLNIPVRCTSDGAAGATVTIPFDGSSAPPTEMSVPWLAIHSWKYQFTADIPPPA
jgi:hypothetical protein